MTGFEYSLLAERFTGAELERAKSRFESGEPLGYILGEWYFYGLTFKIDEHCLMPRPNTEHLVDTALAFMTGDELVLDLCTGCGCVLLSILANAPHGKGYGIDISRGALKKAKENAFSLGLDNRVAFSVADVLCGNMPPDFLPDIITANPPYIRSGEIDSLTGAVKREPRLALDGGEDGLKFYRAIKKHYLPRLKSGGILICEIGYDEAPPLHSLFPGATIKKDYGNKDRVLIYTKK